MQEDFGRLVEQFEASASDLEAGLVDALATVQSGVAPAEDSATTIFELMRSCRSSYESVRAAAGMAQEEGERPVLEYVRVYEEAAAERARGHVEELRRLLEEFLTTRSLGEAYESALAPYKNEAALLVKRLKLENSPEDLGAIEGECEPKSLFIQAMGVEDFDTDEGVRILDGIGEAYSPKVYQGVMLHKYFLPKEENQSGDSSDGVVSAPHSQVDDAVTEEFDRMGGDAGGWGADDAISAREDDAPDATQSDLGTLHSSNVVLNSRVANLSFMKKLMGSAPNCVPGVLPILSYLAGGSLADIVDLISLVSAGVFDMVKLERCVSSALQYLAKKGLLSVYDVPGNDETLYVPTSFARELFERPGVRNMRRQGSQIWELPVGEFPLVSDGEISIRQAEEIIRANRMLRGLLKTYLSEGGTKPTILYVFKSVMWERGTYSVLHPYTDKDDLRCLLVDGESFAPDRDGSAICVPSGKECECSRCLREDFVHFFKAEGDEIFEYGTECQGATDSVEFEEEIGDSSLEGDGFRDEPETAFSGPVSVRYDNIEEASLSDSDEQNEMHPLKGGIAALSLLQPDSGPGEALSESLSDKITRADEGSVSATESELGSEIGIDHSPGDVPINEGETSAGIVGPAGASEGRLFSDCAKGVPLSEDPLRQTASEYASRREAPSDEELVSYASYLLSEADRRVREEGSFGGLGCALAFAKAAADVCGDKRCKEFCRQLAYATGVWTPAGSYSGEGLARAFSEPVDPALMLSAYCLSMISPAMPYDYTLWSTTDGLLVDFDNAFPNLRGMKPLFSLLTKVRGSSPEGLTESVLDQLGSGERREKRLREIRAKACKLCTPVAFKAKMTGLPEFSSGCFGRESDVGLCMAYIRDDSRDEAGFVRDVVEQYGALDSGVLTIDDSKIDARIDSGWHEATRGLRTSGLRDLRHHARKQAVDGFCDRLEVMARWLSLNERRIDSKKAAEMRGVRDDILKEVEDLLSAPGAQPAVIRWMLLSIQARLDDGHALPLLFSDFLETGFVSLDERGVPILDEGLASVRRCEPWRMVLLHIATKKVPLERVCEEIRNPGSYMFDNLSQLAHARSILEGTSYEEVLDELDKKVPLAAAEDSAEKFQDFLEIAYAYNQLNEVQKEDLALIARQYKEVFFERLDFGCWRWFLDGLRLQVSDMASKQRGILSERLAERREAAGEEKPSLLGEAERLFEEGNYAVVEEYLNRLEAGDSDGEWESAPVPQDRDGFSHFISDDVYERLYEQCRRNKGAQFAPFARDFVRRNPPVDWGSRQSKESENFINSWPGGTKNPVTAAGHIEGLLKGLGLQLNGKVSMAAQRPMQFRVSVVPERKDLPDYRHPIAAFGTRFVDPLCVIVLQGNHTAKEIVDTVVSCNPSGIALVILDSAMTLATRREMAEYFHTSTKRLTSFLLLDRVLALHLALHQTTERLPTLLKCALPFTYYQPFVTTGATAEEMFCGRERELGSIIDPAGACVVYGGRQLGKTALLERAQSLVNRPGEGAHAAYVSIIGMTEETSVARALSASLRDGLGIPECSTLGGLCDSLRKSIDEGRAKRVLLLIDEADDYLESMSEGRYAGIQPLVDLKRSTKNAFKFVLAGLHNVARAKNATEENGVFGQLGEPLCVRPLSPSEALQLISKPLGYLGFQVDRFPHLETILTNTNYYPGIIQFFGYTLVETMTKQYGGYYRAVDGNPPYTLEKSQLGAIMNSSSLNTSIKEKFRLSLKLDQRYFMIARCVALMYYEGEEEGDLSSWRRGFSAGEIKQYADSWGIHVLADEDSLDYERLLEEMEDMGILARTDAREGRYRLRRHSFLNIIGATPDMIIDDIENNDRRA